jgi:hypothetical protein
MIHAETQTTRPIRPQGLIANYAFDVDLVAGLDEGHLRDLAGLLRTHASSRQLERLRRVVEDLLRQQRSL